MATPTLYRRYHYVLEPESSDESDGTDKTESVYSMQDKETEYVRDESDTCTKSDNSEYTLNSLQTEDNFLVESSASTSECIIRTENITVEVDEKMSTGSCGSSERDSQSCSEDSELGQADYWNCAQCKKTNIHPKYRYCMKCFRLRKEMFPPKPKGTKKRSNGSVLKPVLQPNKKRKHSSSEQSPDLSLAKLNKIDMDKPMILTSLVCATPDGQSFSSLCNEVETIQAAKRLKAAEDDPAPADEHLTSMTCGSLIGRFGTLNTSSQTFSSLCASLEKVHEEKVRITEEEMRKSTNSEEATSEDTGVDMNSEEMTPPDTFDTSALCIMCVQAPKNAVFLHSTVVHSCCCYPCAIRVWKTTKKCPTCNNRASKVMRLVFS